MIERTSLIQGLQKVVEYYCQTLCELGDVQLSRPIKITLENIEQSPTQLPSEIPQKSIMQNVHQESNFVAEKKAVKSIKPKDNIMPVVNLSSITTLEKLKDELEKSCVCELKAYATKTVFGDGNPSAKIIVIGEAPGQEEDLAGVPFIGRSGELLMNAFRSINLEREKNFYITNNIFWRPPGNRKPTQEEMDLCRPYLSKIIEIIKPEVIICVGSVAAQNVLSSEETISNMRNKIFNQAKALGYTGKIFAIYHPSYLLRNPSKKYDMYKDLLFIKENIGNL